MREFINIILEGMEAEIFWHGSPSGDLRGSHYGLHLGTKDAAREALEARIGVRADGKDWDGTQEYGKTLLAGRETLKRVGRHETGYNCGLPAEDFYPADRTYRAKYSNSEEVAMTARPSIDGFRLVGPMKNTPRRTSNDMRANSWMKKQISIGDLSKGCYYINDGEDAGSLSIVVPDASFIEKVS